MAEAREKDRNQKQPKQTKQHDSRPGLNTASTRQRLSVFKSDTQEH